MSKNTKVRAALVIIAIIISVGLLASSKEQTSILCITGVPETTEANYYQNAAAYAFYLNHFLDPENITHKKLNVKTVDWYEADEELVNIHDYDALILWDTPTKIKDDRDVGLHYTDVNSISDKNARKIVDFVEMGGGLVVAGGLTNYGNNAPMLGATQAKGNRDYIGYAKSPLANVLPVEVPDSRTLVPMADNNKKPLKPITPNTGILKGINITSWPCNAYHKVTPKKSAKVLYKLENEDPLIAVWSRGRGRVACVMLAPRANNLVANQVKELKNPLFSNEAILWDRLLRWSIEMPLNSHAENAVVTKYKQIISNPKKIPLSELQAQYPYATHALGNQLPGNLRELALKFYNQCNFNQIVVQNFPNQNKNAVSSLNRDLIKNNLRSFMHTDLAVEPRHQKIPNEKWAQVTLPSSEYALCYGAPAACPYNSLVQNLACEKAEQIAAAAVGSEHINGCVFDDEWAWVLGYRHPYQGDQGLACYSPWVNEMYKEKTGKLPPMPTYREPGYVAPEDDPWLLWCIEIRQDAFEEYNEKVQQAFKKHKPDFKVCNYPGGFEGNLDIMIEEVYLDCWRESELETVERMDMRSNFRQDKYRDKHDMWPLIGIFRMPEDKSVYPETVRLTAGLCLGTGARAIMLWNAANLWAPNLQIPDRPPLHTEAQKLGEFLHKYGCMFKYLKKVPADVWVSSGWFWMNSYDNYYHIPPEDGKLKDMERPWWMFQVSDIAGPAMLRSGMYVEFVTEKQLMSKDVLQKKAVLLPGMLYCRQGIVDNLEAYIRKGGKVFTDQSCKIDIEGAVKLDNDFSKWHYVISAGDRPTTTPTEENYRKQQAMRKSYVEAAIPEIKQKIKSVVNPDIVIENTKACYTLMQNGNAKYLFVYNSDTDNSNKIEVKLKKQGKYVYDIKSNSMNTAGPDGLLNMKLRLKAGDWKVLLLTEQKMAKVKLDKCDLSGNTVKLKATAQDDKGATFSAAVPVEISFNNSKAQTYTVYRATSQGSLETSVEIPQWFGKPTSISIKEMMTKTVKTAQVI